VLFAAMGDSTHGSWNVPLYVMGVLFVIGTACWVIVDPERPVFDEGLAPGASAPPLYTPPRRHRR